MDHRTLTGVWENQLKSRVVLKATEDKKITGNYHTAVGNATDGAEVTGFWEAPTADSLLVVLCVAWRKVKEGKRPSTTCWNGTLLKEPESGSLVIDTKWLLVRSNEELSVWDSTLVGGDKFSKVADTCPVTIVKETDFLWEKYNLLESTMEVAVATKEQNPNVAVVVVSAVQQSRGRGTGGSVWLSPEGNVYVNIALAKSLVTLPREILPMTTALAVYQTVQELATLGCVTLPSMCVKWPNDLLIDRKKVSGCLIEQKDDFYNIGIGINVAVAPVVTDGGRETNNISKYIPNATADLTIQKLVPRLRALCQLSQQHVVEGLRTAIDWSLEMRSKSTDRRPVRPIKLHDDGSLDIVYVDNGETATVLFEYFI